MNLTEQKINELKQQLENNKSFQGWNKAIGLSFDDFDIVELIKNDTKLLTHKKGKKDIGKYSIIIKNSVIDSFHFDMANETVRQNRLNFIASLKVS